jgi:hypothetical protein
MNKEPAEDFLSTDMIDRWSFEFHDNHDGNNDCDDKKDNQKPAELFTVSFLEHKNNVRRYNTTERFYLMPGSTVQLLISSNDMIGCSGDILFNVRNDGRLL